MEVYRTRMKPEDAQNWKEALTPEQQDRLRWLQDHRCMIEVRFAPEDVMLDLPPELVMQAKVDRHAVVKIRGSDIGAMFDYVFKAASALYEYVEQFDPTSNGARPA